MPERVPADAVARRLCAGPVALSDLVALIDERAARQRQQDDCCRAFVLTAEAMREPAEVVVGQHPSGARAGPPAQLRRGLDRATQGLRVPRRVQQLEHEYAVEVLEI